MALLRNSLAPQDGGSASLESIGPRAKAAYDQYVKLIRNKKSRPADWKRQLEKAKETLHDVQALAGRILDAKGLMMVQPGQTLSSIAYQFYGNPIGTGYIRRIIIFLKVLIGLSRGLPW